MSIHCMVFSEREKKNDVRRMCVCVFYVYEYIEWKLVRYHFIGKWKFT